MVEFVENIRKALDSLDRQADDDWNKDGTPAVARVRELADDPSITKADIEAARPNFTRPTAAEPSDGSKEPDENATPEDQAQDSDGEAGQNDAPEVSSNDNKADPQDDEGDEPETGMSLNEFMVRGMLMAIILRLPAPMRILADGEMLDNMAEFVASFDLQEEQHVAVEMIKSISEVKMGEIPSGQYKLRVMAAMDVVRGDLSDVRTGIAPADDRRAAALRLATMTGTASAQPPGYVAPSVLDVSKSEALKGATAEQAESHARLYGADAGVRSADE